jgi:hypothetical protein
MKQTGIHEWRLYGDAAFSLLMFPLVVGLMYWLIRLGCTAAFRAIAGQ